MATNVTETSQVKSSGIKFEDFFSFNITEGEVIQNRIRIVKVSGKNYIAFSRYFCTKKATLTVQRSVTSLFPLNIGQVLKQD